MQYLMSVIDDGENVDRGDEMEVVGRFNDGLRSEGRLVYANGLTAPSDATVVDRRSGGDPVITDGPFIESREYLAGFWIVEADDLDQALRFASEGSAACNRKVEVRPFH